MAAIGRLARSSSTATVIVLRRSTPESPTFDVSAEAGPGETLTSPLLSGFELAIDGLFGD